MQHITEGELSDAERLLLEKAILTAEKTIAKPNQKVGAALLCKDGSTFVGATLARRRVIGSTCAERMAVDQLYFSRGATPKVLAVVGIFPRPNWTENSICTPCGPCLEMLWELIMDYNLQDLQIICSSWSKKRIVRTTLLELFPKVDPVDARR
jgi:cytidine deaminase